MKDLRLIRGVTFGLAQKCMIYKQPLHQDCKDYAAEANRTSCLLPRNKGAPFVAAIDLKHSVDA